MAKTIKTKAITMRWLGPELLKALDNASGDGLAKGAEILGKDIQNRLEKLKTDKPSGWGWWAQKWQPGYMAKETRWGKFRGKRDANFVGGFVRLLGGIWHLVEFGTGRSDKKEFLKPAIQANRTAVFRAATGNMKAELPKFKDRGEP